MSLQEIEKIEKRIRVKLVSYVEFMDEKKSNKELIEKYKNENESLLGICDAQTRACKIIIFEKMGE